MRTNIFQWILLPIIFLAISHRTSADNDQPSHQGTASNQPLCEQQTNGVSDSAKQERIIKIREFQKVWVVERQNRPQSPIPIYHAKYQDGDWNCNPHALPNFASAISNLTQGKVRLTCNTLDIGTGQLLGRKPCFIYFTGNKEFTLQDSEIEELRQYVNFGGVVWIDSAKPGRNTPFDIAVHRELKRVFPDREFKPLSTNSFRNASGIYDMYFKGVGFCPGLSGAAEPIEVITVGDELGVIYTLNGYGAMWEMLSSINTSSKPNDAGDDSLTQEAVVNCIKFGYNIVNFSFTRYVP